MKKLIIAILLNISFCTVTSFGQYSLLQNSNVHLSTKGFDVSSGKIILGSILSRPGAVGSNFNDLVISSDGNFPLTFRIGVTNGMRLNNFSDLGVGAFSGYNHDPNNFATNNTILSHLHSQGVGGMAINTALGAIKSAILGQAIGLPSTSTGVGIIGMTDGSADSKFKNIGVLAIGTTALTTAANTYNFYGDIRTSTENDVYGLFTNQNNNGTGRVYGIKTNSLVGGTREAFGSFNSVQSNSIGNIYGTYNVVNQAGVDVGNRLAYGSYNSASAYRTGAIGTYNTASGSGGGGIGTLNELSSINNSTTLVGESNHLITGGIGGATGVNVDIVTSQNSKATWHYGIYSIVSNDTSTDTLSNDRRAYAGYFYSNCNDPKFGYGIFTHGSTYGSYSEGDKYGAYNDGITYGSYNMGKYASYNTGGVYGSINYGSSYGVYANAPTAGYFQGNITVTGTII